MKVSVIVAPPFGAQALRLVRRLHAAVEAEVPAGGRGAAEAHRGEPFRVCSIAGAEGVGLKPVAAEEPVVGRCQLAAPVSIRAVISSVLPSGRTTVGTFLESS